MKKNKLLPFLAAACCSFMIAGVATATTPYFIAPTTASATQSETLLNGCEDATGFWCNAGATLNTDATYIEQGAASVCVSTAGWGPININLGTSSVTNYTYVKMTVWSTQAVKLLAGDINFNTDPNCVLAELAVGKNEVVIPVEKLAAYNLTSQIIAPYLSGNTTLYIDNIVGLTSAPSSAQENLLNGCENATGFWCNAGATVNTNPSYVEQGAASVCVSTAGWGPININLGTSSITNYTHVKMTVWSTQAVKLLAGDINFNTDPNCVLAELAVGKNEVIIPVEKLAAYNLTSQIIAPYLSGDTTLYIDNIIGIVEAEEGESTPSSLFNSCDTADGTWVETNGSYAIESTLQTQGNASIRLNLAAGNYFKLTLRSGDNPLTKEQLLSYDYLVLDVCNNESSAVDLFLYDTKVATLSPNWNSVTISKATIEAEISKNAAQFTDGKFYFKVATACTLLVDNVRGMSQEELNASYADFNGVSYSAATTGSPACVKFGASSVTTLTAAQASAAGVPSGYTDNVIYATGGNQGVGVLLDFTSLQIPYTTVEYIAFRVYFPAENAGSGYPDIRVYNPDASGTYAVNYDASTVAGTWYDFTLKPGETFNGSHNFSHLSTDGYLGQFEFAIRSNNTSALYIDSISYKLTTDVEVEDYDTPVITYHGENTVYTLAGEVFSVEATAYDKTQGNVSVKQTWSAGAVDASGKLNAGTHTLTLTATDLGNNTATKQITVIAVKHDGIAPVINLPTTSLTLPAGTRPQLIPEITDDSGAPVTVTTVWSAGALNNKKELVAGTHTYTITATDISGNSATQTVTVTVTENGLDGWNDIVDESTPVTYTLHANGGSGSTVSDVVAKGTKITLPACPFTAPEGYSFSAWAIGSASGEQKQVSDLVTISGDTTIYAIWTKNHVHEDTDKNHLCDGCSEKLSECADSDTDNDHNCDTCGAKLNDCADSDTDNDHNCDTCGAKLNDCADSNTDNDHVCDTCGAKLNDCADSSTDNDHACDVCGEPCGDHAFGGAFEQNANGHWNYCNCGQISETLPHVDDDKNHACDVCNRTMSSCADSSSDNDHNCDICGNPYGDHDFTGNWQSDEDGHYKVCNCGEPNEKVAHADSNDHLCDVCNYKLSDCADSDTDGDHNCDLCGARLNSCENNDGDHVCDVCNEKLSDCVDDDKNHACDICGEEMGAHQGTSTSHVCEYCGNPASDCTDSSTDGDHACDICGAKLDDCVDSDNNHFCDSCGEKVGDCVDDDKNHACDVCDKQMGTHEGTSTSHVCEYCGNPASGCVDSNNDHDCDICGEALTTCNDADNDHDCDSCGETLTTCKDDDNDGNCDVCGNSVGGGNEGGEGDSPDPAPETPATSGGCFGSVGGATAITLTAAVALTLLRKKKDRE